MDAERSKLSLVQSLSANALQVDRDSVPASFEYTEKQRKQWRYVEFRQRARRAIRDSLPEVQEAHRQRELARVQRKIEAKANYIEWHEKFEGMEGFAECFDGFGSE
jgi:hypothetical protein